MYHVSLADSLTAGQLGGLYIPWCQVVGHRIVCPQQLLVHHDAYKFTGYFLQLGTHN